MSRLLQGSLLVLFVLIVAFVTAFIQTGAESTATGFNCGTGQNATACNNAGQTSFITAVRAATINPLPGAPAFFNALWVLIGVFLLTAGVLLIVSSFIPLLSS